MGPYKLNIECYADDATLMADNEDEDNFTHSTSRMQEKQNAW